MSTLVNDRWYEQVNQWLEEIGVGAVDIHDDSKGMYIMVDGNRVALPSHLQAQTYDDKSDDNYEQVTNV